MALSRAVRWTRPSALALVGGVAAVIVALPLLGVVLAALQPGETGLPPAALARYLATSAALAIAVAGLTAIVGTATAWLTVTCRFPLSRFFGWSLALPLALPAFAIAYAYADLLDVAGELRTWLRAVHGVDLPVRIRSTPGAAFILSMIFYPYVFLTMRAAFLVQSADLLDAARSLGAHPARRFWRVALPVARPALAAGVALAAMETLADYGAVKFLSVDTLTTGIVRAWSGAGSVAGAAQLALPLLAAAALFLWIERAARTGASHETGRGRYRSCEPVQLRGFRALGATTICALPLVLGLLLPAAWLLRMALKSNPDWPRLWDAGQHSIVLAASGAALTVILALGLALGVRRAPAVIRLVGLGYATPGAAMAIGLLAPMAIVWRGFGYGTGLAICALLLAYAARLMAAAHEPVAAGLARVSPSIHQAARALGRSTTRAALGAELPLLGGSVLTAMLLVFIDIAKELPATLILRPFNFETLATIANNYALDERLGQAAWPSLLVLLICLPPLIVLSGTIVGSRPGR